MINHSPDTKNNTRKGERGNFFTVLLAAVGLAGLLGVATYNMMSGPLATLSRASTQGVTDGELISAARVMMLDAVTQTDGGDCDADDYVEPRGWTTSAIAPTGGGKIPTTIGAPANDAWGNPIGYCVWDIDDSSTTCGNDGVNRLDGTPDPNTGETISQTVMAVFSAGPDKKFQSTCIDYTDGTTAVATRDGDDIMHTYSYAEAAASTSGIWRLKSGDPDTGSLIDGKDAQVGADISFDESEGKGTFAAVSATGAVIAGGGAMIGEPAACGAGSEGLIKYTTDTCSATTFNTQTTTDTDGNATATLSSYIVPDECNRILIVLATAESATPNNTEGASATFDGTPMTRVDYARATGAPSGWGNAATIFYLLNPAATTGNVVGLFVGNVSSANIAALTVSGLAQQAPLSDAESLHTAEATPPTYPFSIAANPATDAFIIDVIAGNNDYAPSVFTQGGGETKITEVRSTGGHQLAASYKSVAAGATSMSWSASQPYERLAMQTAVFETSSTDGEASIQYCDGTSWQGVDEPPIDNSFWTRATDDIYYDTGSVNIATATATNTSLLKIVGDAPKMAVRNISDCGGSCGGTFDFYRARGTSAAPQSTLATDVLGTFDFFGYGASSFERMAQIQVTQTDTAGATYIPSQLQIKTQNGAGILKTIATLTNTGLGIGTTAPSDRLHLKTASGAATISNSIVADSYNASASQPSEINFRKSGNTFIIRQGGWGGPYTINNVDKLGPLGFLFPVLAGSSVIVVMEGYRAGAPAFSMPASNAVYDTQGNTYTLVKEGAFSHNGTDGSKPYIYVAHNTSAAGLSVHIDPTETSGNYIKFNIYEVIGLDPSSTYDQAGQASSNSTTPVGCGGLTVQTTASTTQEQELAVAVLTTRTASANSNIQTASAWTSRALLNDSTNGSLSVFTKNLSAFEQPTHSWTYDYLSGGCVATEGASGIIATFKAKSTGVNALSDSSVVGRIDYNAADSTSTTQTVGRIEGIVNTTTGGAVAINNLPIDLAFKVGNSTTGLSERMRIDNRGYIGFNRSPGVRLDIDTGVFLNSHATSVDAANGATGAGKKIVIGGTKGGFVGGELTSGGGKTTQWDDLNTGEYYSFGWGTDIDAPLSGNGGFSTIIGKTQHLGNKGIKIGENHTNSAALCVVVGKNNVCNDDLASSAIGNSVAAARQSSISIGNNITYSGFNHSAYTLIGNKLNLNRTGDTTNGFYIGLSSTTTTDIGSNLSNTFAVIGASGKWGIGTVTPAHVLDVVGIAEDDTTTTWANASDLRLKNILGPYDKSLADITRLETVRFNYKKNNPVGYDPDLENQGFVAQKVQPVFPEAVSLRPDGYLDFNMHSISVAMINALKELDHANNELAVSNEALRQQNKKIKTAMTGLSERLDTLKKNKSLVEHVRQSPWTGFWLLPVFGLAGIFAFSRPKKGGQKP